MIVMDAMEALLKIEEFTTSGEQVDICKYRYGNLIIDRGGVERGLTLCPYCGMYIPMGVIVVAHEDGRAVHFNVGLFHYAEAGHPLPEDVVDQLVAIVSDVCNECNEKELGASAGLK